MPWLKDALVDNNLTFYLPKSLTIEPIRATLTIQLSQSCQNVGKILQRPIDLLEDLMDDVLRAAAAWPAPR